MTKKTLIITAILLAMIFVFVGCAGETFKFDALTVETMDGELTNNGGVSVAYKGYTYFINGNVGTYSDDNTFGKVTYGAICRVKTATLTNGTFNGRDLINEEYPEVEVLAPKAVYTTATNSPETNGIFIFGDRIYYSTPSTTRDKEGAIQNTKLDIMSVKLDGTDTQRLYTVAGNSYDMMYAQKDQDVFAIFLNGEELYSVNLTASKATETLVAEHVTSAMFAHQVGIAVFTQTVPEEGHEGHDHEATYSSINLFVAGQEESEVLIDGAGDSVFEEALLTLTKVTNDSVYFTVNTDNAGREGLYRISMTERNVSFANNSAISKIFGSDILTGGLIYNANGEENFVVYNESEQHVQLYNLATRTTTNLFYMTSEPTFVSVDSNKLIYIVSAQLKYFDMQQINNADFDGRYVADEDNVAISENVNAVTWLGYDVYQDYMLYLSTTESEVYLYYTDFNDIESEEKVAFFVGLYVQKATEA